MSGGPLAIQAIINCSPSGIESLFLFMSIFYNNQQQQINFLKLNSKCRLTFNQRAGSCWKDKAVFTRGTGPGKDPFAII